MNIDTRELDAVREIGASETAQVGGAAKWVLAATTAAARRIALVLMAAFM